VTLLWTCRRSAFLAGVSHDNLALDQQVNPKLVFMVAMQLIWNTSKVNLNGVFMIAMELIWNTLFFNKGMRLV
jgi:hypothetical protein